MVGKIIIGTEINNNKFDKQMRDLENKYKNKTIDFDLTTKQLHEAENAMERMKDRTEEMNQKYKNITKEIAKQEKIREKITVKQDDGSVKIPWENVDQYNKINRSLETMRAERSSLLDQIIAQNKETSKQEKQLEKINARYEKQSNQISEIQQKMQQVKANKLKDQIDGIGSSLGKAVKKVGKWALAVFGLRSAYMAVRNAINIISQNDEQLKADVDYMKSAFAYTLEPVIRKIVEWAQQLMILIQNIAYRLTGKNIFANVNKSLQGANKEASKLSKTMAGFDEMNVLSDNSGGGGGGTTAPSIDLSKLQSLGDTVKNKWKEMLDTLENTDWRKVGGNVYNKIKSFFTDIDWGGIFSSVFEGIGAVLGATASFVIGFLEQAWTDIKNYFSKWIDESVENGGSVVEGLLLGIWNAIKDIGIWIWDHIFKPFIDGFKKAFGIHSPSTVMQEMGSFLVDGLKNGLSNIWEKVKSIFENLKTKIVDIFKQTWEGIKSAFSGVKSFFTDIITTIVGLFKNIGTKVGDSIGGAFKSVINFVLGKVEGILNTPIKGINKLLDKVNTLPGVNIGTLSTFSFPRLAKGGIVNMPSRGVPVGNAIAGERGAEGVIPLTDSQQMALLGEAIGKYVTINATIPVYAYNRQVDRQIKRIKAEDDFAYNG